MSKEKAETWEGYKKEFDERAWQGDGLTCVLDGGGNNPTEGKKGNLIDGPEGLLDKEHEY